MIDDDWQEVKPFQDPEESQISKFPPSELPINSEWAKKELINFHKKELEILKYVENYPDYVDYRADINEDVILANNPGYRQDVTVAVESIQGLKGFHFWGAEKTKKITIMLARDEKLNEDITSALVELGVETNVHLVVGIYSDEATLDQMKVYIAKNPDRRHRLMTDFYIDSIGNGIKCFLVPVDMPIDESKRRLVRINEEGTEKTVYDDITAEDIEIMNLGLAQIDKHLPKS